MLIKDVVQNYKGRVKFVSENWGDSKLAERYGVKRYPVVFVDDVLVAKPSDFGWMGEKGKYTPWKERANHEKFKKDLTRMIALALRDRDGLASRYGTRPDDSEIASLPQISAKTINGERVEAAELSGRVVVIEFWATWCPPCRSTLSRLAEIKRHYGDEVTILAIAVESEEPEVRKLAETLSPSVKVIIGSEDLMKPFGDIASVPTLFVFDKNGSTASVFYGAPEDLHERIGLLIDSLID